MEDYGNNELALELIKKSTGLIYTPEQAEYPEGTFWVYSHGMMDNYGLPDLEIRGVAGMFLHAAAQTINEINAYRVTSDKPILVDQTIDWAFGNILVQQGEDWEGAYEWKAEDMLRLTSALTDVPCCHSCDCEKHGITE
jgi:hypothetical protein